MSIHLRRIFACIVGALLFGGCFDPVDESGRDGGYSPSPSPELPRVCGAAGRRTEFYPWRPELEGCTVFAGDLYVTFPVPVSGIGNASSINAVEGTLAIVDNAELTSLDGLEGIQRVGHLMVATNTVLEDMTGLGSIHAGTDVTVLLNPALRSLDGLGRLRSVRNLVIQDNAQLRSLDGLSALEEITGDLTLRGNSSLPSVEVQAFISRVRVDGRILR